MIIIEGADNVGKTTLIKQLLELDGDLRLLRRPSYRPEYGGTIGTSYIHALTPPDGDCVRHGYSLADRLVASECIYGRLFRDTCRLSLGEHLALEQLLISYNALVLWCDVSDATITASWNDREQLYSPQDPRRIAEAYRKRVRRIFAGLSVRRYSWTDADAAEARQTISKEHRHRHLARSRALSWWNTIPYGMGQLDAPAVMFVGEALSPQANSDVPFATGPAGEFLAWTLERVFTVWPRLRRQTYITNALKDGRDDVGLLREELAFLQPEIVVALGQEAEKMIAAAQHRGPLVTIEHPMFWRRFHWPRRLDYPATLVQKLRAQRLLGAGARVAHFVPFTHEDPFA